jgi:aminopeptidase N
LLYQLVNDSDCMGRIEASVELAKISDSEITAALGKALKDDRFWGVQVEIADALAKIRTESARDALVGGLTLPHPKARRGVVRALGTYRDAVAAEALAKVAAVDPSYYVEAEAVYAAATAMLPPESKESRIRETEAFLLEQLEKPSYREVIRAAALRALSELPGIGRDERPAALSALSEWSGRGKPEDARIAAIDALGRVVRTANPAVRERLLDSLDRLADEDAFRVRMGLVRALRASETPQAAGILEKLRRLELDGRVRRKAAVAADDLYLMGGTPETVVQLKTSLEKLEEDYRKLRSLFEEKIGANRP